MNLPGAFNELINQTAEKYHIDFVLIDLNPGLSAINQNLFILSDAFIIPTNPDPFSIMALRSLATILPRWVKWADDMRPIFETASYPLSDSRPKFIGEIIQRFNIRKGKAATPFMGNINEIKTIITETFIPSIAKNQMLFESEAYLLAQMSDDYCLAEIPDFQSILQKANNVGVPVFAITDNQINEAGSVLSQFQDKRQDFYNLFEKIAHQIITIGKYANSTQPVFA
jgi:hypothetical protein